MIVISVAVVIVFVFVAVVLVAAVSAVDSAYVATDGWLAVEYFRIISISTSSSVGFYKGPLLTRTTVSTTTTTSSILCIYTVASFKFIWPVNVRSFFKKILLELMYQVIGG